MSKSFYILPWQHFHSEGNHCNGPAHQSRVRCNYSSATVTEVGEESD